MGTLIDSSVLVAAERAKESVASMLVAHREEKIAIAAITASELLHGVHRAGTAAQKVRRTAFVETVLSVVPVVSFDFVTARLHARLWAELASRGFSIGTHDLLIAATAMAHDFTVATRDKRSFAKIDGLKVVEW